MAHCISPRKSGVRNPQPLKKHDAQQGSRKNRIVWRSEIAGRIIPITNPVDDFLGHFVPGHKPRRPVMKSHFDFPSDAKVENDLYEPLCEGFTSLVSRFDEETKPTFVNHNHNRITFPYALGASEHHVTRPDVIASFPGETSVSPHADYWRNISFVVEVKLKESEDPMKSYSQEHEETLIQLAKSARNLLVSQSRLFVFVIGIYGRLARIFRFDHGGAVCSRAFNYTTLQGSRHLHEFLYRFTHPLHDDCRIVGSDPTVELVGSEERANVVSMLRNAGVNHEDSDEASKAYRYITVSPSKGQHVKYLAYDLVFINPHLFSRATTVWEAIEIGPSNEATGHPVIVKDSWRQLVRQLESDNYKDIFSSAKDATDMSGVAKFLGGEDLGTSEIESMDNGEPGGGEIGHLTVTARHCVNGKHANNERSHTRLVLGTVGIPLSRFNSTREMVEALRDAIQGHRKLFEGGVVHRDISEGNVMISRNPESQCTGYIQDLDYGLNWIRFLKELGWGSEEAEWDAFVRDESAKIRKIRKDTKLARAYTKRDTPKPVFEQKAGADGGDISQQNGANAQTDNRSGSSFGAKQSLGTLDGLGKDEADDAPGGVEVSRRDELKPTERRTPSAEDVKMQCKVRTGTLYFMAVEIIEGGVVHEVRHDLESFFWLLLWLVLRHTDHDAGPRGCELIFDGDTDTECKFKKAAYLDEEVGVFVHGNEPLCMLLEEFRDLCSNNHWRKSQPPVPLTYDSVLDVFKKALDMEWPSDDKALPYILPADDEEISPVPCQSRKRHTSNIRSSQIQSEGQSSHDLPKTDRSGQSRLPRAGTQSAAQRRVGETNGSARKRSREQRDTSEVVDPQPVRSKRTRTNSERGQSASGRRGRSVGK
ncbi:uncharacterized protein B0H18DRAFT_1215343 [Fomitopsis serialis]|uniref:uncharacterized protein n=1 Tax=Fomitopsis serialis TaxID=139415 RepID=UPI0020079768|nr:uncharacterized protein B0H18DRAFT_1215343 [Neoantrodia serialis]KAH9915730.1 hypothetical protein B0H18DRAFT_1215343 [Neoantrodia serialis]